MDVLGFAKGVNFLFLTNECMNFEFKIVAFALSKPDMDANREIGVKFNQVLQMELIANEADSVPTTECKGWQWVVSCRNNKRAKNAQPEPNPFNKRVVSGSGRLLSCGFRVV
ncbi:Aminotransferase-like, plant mobile domain family protein [Prunus dulcis]|uniref:Aminotransferase-like, plant mobile domain family protein n=1 Tax=Prunus dulcis TaxID=3755 RepID=A0A4Y1RD75_PRUDU|nr:Aminotransferase-like, plant mobile domain family protein [Prunus dulcis]